MSSVADSAGSECGYPNAYDAWEMRNGSVDGVRGPLNQGRRMGLVVVQVEELENTHWNKSGKCIGC